MELETPICHIHTYISPQIVAPLIETACIWDWVWIKLKQLKKNPCPKRPFM